MKNRKMLLLALLSVALVFSLILPAPTGASATPPLLDDHSPVHSVMDGSSLTSAMPLNMPQGQVTPMVSAGDLQTVGLKSDGTVFAVGDNTYGQCNITRYRNIVQVAAGWGHTVGLKSDGSVIAVGLNLEGQCNVDDWTDIVQVAAGTYQTLGLKSDATLVAAGNNLYGECNVGGWTHITQVATGCAFTVGVKDDGTVVAVGHNVYGQCEVANWTGIVQVAAGDYHTVGLKSDGTVVAVGDNSYGQCNVTDWTGIVQVSAGKFHTVGLKSDGTVVATGWDNFNQCNVGSWTGIIQVDGGYWYTVGLRSDGTLVAVGYNQDGQCNVSSWVLSQHTPMVSAFDYQTVGLKSDGTVVAVGYNEQGQCNVSDWTGIVQIDTGWPYTVGLKSDGTVVAAGNNLNGACNVGDWTDIAQVAAGDSHTVGLKSDGTVVAVGYNGYGECDVGGWTDIVQVASGGIHTVGLRSDGTVVASGNNWYGQCDVGGWTDIVQVAAGGCHTVGLKSDGTVVAVGRNFYGECLVGDWTNIIQVSAHQLHTVGLKSDGTVVAIGRNLEGQCNVGNWTGIIQVAAAGHHTVGLKSDGTVVAVGLNGWGDCDVGGWTLFPHQIVRYGLTISSTVGGSVTTPGEGTFTYDEGTVVDLMAAPSAGHRFVNWTGDVSTIANVNHTVTKVTMNGNYSAIASFSVAQYTPMVSAYDYQTVGLKSDGTVVATGYNEQGQCNVGDWTGIVQVDTGWLYTVGLKSDGTVVVMGNNLNGACSVGDWTDIVQVDAGDSHTVGLKSDGTAVAVGYDGHGECDVGGWTDIVQVASGGIHTVGLRSDGTVVAIGDDFDGQCNVGDWTDIIQVSAGGFHTVGLKSDGTVVAAGESQQDWNRWGQCNVGDWTDIIQVSAGAVHTVGLKSDGTAVAVGYNLQGQCDVGNWTDIVQVAAAGRHTVGLKSDGTVVAAGFNGWGDCDVGDWDLDETAHEALCVECNVNPNPTTVGHETAFTAEVSGGVPPYSWSWTVNGTQVATTQNTTYTFTTAGNYTVCVTLTDSLGNNKQCCNNVAVRILLIQSEEDTPGTLSHILALNVTRPIDESKKFGERIAQITSQNGLAIIAHPNDPPGSVDATSIAKAGGITAMEIYNAGSLAKNYEGVWDMVLDMRAKGSGRPVWGIASDDAHWENHPIDGDQYGKTWVMVRASQLDRDHVLEALQNGSFYAVLGPTSVSQVIQDISLSADDTTINITMNDAVANDYRAQVIRGWKAGQPPPTFEDQKTFTYVVDKRDTWVRIGISFTTSAFASRAWTQPFMCKDGKVVINPYETTGSWYKAQFHCHTTRSDGKLTPEAVVQKYSDLGYDILAVTDHNRITKVGSDLAMYVADLQLSYKRGLLSAKVTVKGHDQQADPSSPQDYPAREVTVTGYWKNVSGSLSQGTDEWGVATFDRRLSPPYAGTYTFVVESISKPGWIWDGIGVDPKTITVKGYGS
jgi:alpha-tubulin suppressor-like RCC1 family protein